MAHGNLLRLRPRPGDTVAIIDGYFHQWAAVRHKEILLLLESGVTVLGAASMGALRAVELEPFGMRGVGQIFRAFAAGEIEGDDEVAVLHGPAEDGYPTLSEALFNIRHNLDRACQRGACGANTARAALHIACGMPYMDRSYTKVLNQVVASGADAVEVAALHRFLETEREDVKEGDALDLVGALRDQLEAKRARPVRGASHRPTPAGIDGSNDSRPFALQDSIHLWAWAGEASGWELPETGFVSEAEALGFCRLLAADYPQFQRTVALRAIAATYAHELGLAPGPVIARPQQRLGEGPGVTGMPTDGDLARHSIEESALRSLRAALEMDGLDDLDFLRAAVARNAVELGLIESLDRLPWRRGACREWLTAAELSLPPAEQVARFAARSWCVSPVLVWQQPLVRTLKVTGRLATALDGVNAARHFGAETEARNRGLRVEDVPGDRVVAWFAERWDAGDDLDVALLDRGFADADELASAGRLLYLFDKYDGRYRDFRLAGHSAPPGQAQTRRTCTDVNAAKSSSWVTTAAR